MPTMISLTAFALAFCASTGVQCEFKPLLDQAANYGYRWCLAADSRQYHYQCGMGLYETLPQDCQKMGDSSTGWNVMYCRREVPVS
jgi:hypothetical protein